MQSRTIHFRRFVVKSMLALSISQVSLTSHAAEFHVSPAGKDSNPGSAEAPFASLSKARDAARKVAGKEAVTVHVEDGMYYLPETLVFRP
jgi:hypothetical protein